MAQRGKLEAKRRHSVMDLTQLVRDSFELHSDEWAKWVPADHMNRQCWQDEVEAFVGAIRRRTGRPAFGITEAEISVQYHMPIYRFVVLIGERLGKDIRIDPKPRHHRF